MRKRNLDSMLTLMLPSSMRSIIESVADERGVSRAEFTRELLNAGMVAKGLVA